MDMLYHYCSLEKFNSIIDSKTLWLTRLTKSNDSEEVRRTFEIIWGKIRNKLKDELSDIEKIEELIDNLDQQMKLEIALSEDYGETPFGVCFTVNCDLAQSWNEYGDHSKGVALGFSPDIFNGIAYSYPHPNCNFNQAIGWNYVYYDKNGLEEDLKNLILKILRDNPTLMGIITVRTTLKHYSAFIKNPTYCDEREARIIYYPYKTHNSSNIPGVSNRIEDPIPHCLLPWIKNDGKCALKEIIIGTNCKYTEENIKKILEDHNIKSHIEIRQSEYSYRISDNK